MAACAYERMVRGRGLPTLPSSQSCMETADSGKGESVTNEAGEFLLLCSSPIQDVACCHPTRRQCGNHPRKGKVHLDLANSTGIEAVMSISDMCATHWRRGCGGPCRGGRQG